MDARREEGGEGVRKERERGRKGRGEGEREKENERTSIVIVLLPILTFNAILSTLLP